jgi:hypothetical protein
MDLNLNTKIEVEFMTESDDQKYNFIVLPDPVILASLNKSSCLSSMHLIMGLFYYTDEKIFISFTQNENESSLIVTESYIKKYFFEHKINHDCCIYGKKYYVFKMIEYSTEIGKVGIVNSLSKIMADNNISILYITTYNNDYILVEDDKKKEAVDCLVKNGYFNETFDMDKEVVDGINAVDDEINGVDDEINKDELIL